LKLAADWPKLICNRNPTYEKTAKLHLPPYQNAEIQ
jgi:hypothetical protein